jgi:hypothetical protein
MFTKLNEIHEIHKRALNVAYTNRKIIELSFACNN